MKIPYHIGGEYDPCDDRVATVKLFRHFTATLSIDLIKQTHKAPGFRVANLPLCVENSLAINESLRILSERLLKHLRSSELVKRHLTEFVSSTGVAKYFCVSQM